MEASIAVASVDTYISYSQRLEEIRRLIKESEDTQYNSGANALATAQRAIDLASDGGQDFETELADSLRQRAVVRQLSSDFYQALEDLGQALLIYEASSNPRGLAIVHFLMGVGYAFLEIIPDAMQQFQIAYEYFKDAGDADWKILMLNNIGYTHNLLHSPREAMVCLEEALILLEKNGNTAQFIEQSNVLDSLAMAYRLDGDLDKALEVAVKGIEVANKTNQYMYSETLIGLGKIYMERGEIQESITRLREATDLALSCNFRNIIAQASYALGEALIHAQDYQEAESRIKTALTNAQITGLQQLIFSCFRSLGEICKKRGDFPGALAFFSQLIEVSEQVSLQQAKMRLRVLEITNEVEKTRKENLAIRDRISQSQVETIFALARLAETRDNETGQHIERVQILSKTLAVSLRSIDKFGRQIDGEFINRLYFATPLHDIGKVGIPDEILLKKGKLTRAEFEIMKTHTEIGSKTLISVRDKYPDNPLIEMGIAISRSHHERWDGTGYPDGLAGEQIQLSARIMAIVDVYDALRSRRVYKPAYSHAETCAILAQERGRQLDPELVDCFLANQAAFEQVWATYASTAPPLFR